MLRRIAAGLPVLVWAAFVYVTQVGPREAQSNLAQWFSLLGVRNWPTWLTDTRALVIATALLLVFYVVVLGIPFWRKHRAAASRLPSLPLNVRVNRFTAVLRDEQESKGYFWVQEIDYRAITILGLEITNKTSEGMSIECALRLALKSKSVRDRLYIEPGEHPLQEGYAGIFQYGVVNVPAHMTTTDLNKVFGIAAYQVSEMRGLQNLAEGEDHQLILTDRVSDRTHKVQFKLLA